MVDDTEKKDIEEPKAEDTSAAEDTPVEDVSEVKTDDADSSEIEPSQEQASEEEPEEIVEEADTEKPEKKKRAKKPRKTKEKPKKETLKKKKIAKVDKVALFNKKYLKEEIPKFKPGDTVRVHYQIVEGNKTRIQVFEGVCIARKHSGLNETFKVRKMSGQIGVERTFFLHSRRIEKIEVKKVGRVRRAKIYYLRGKVGKQARIREAGIH